MSFTAAEFLHTKPLAPKSGSRLTPPTGLVAPGMWSVVLGANGTTWKTVRWKVEGKAELITVLPPVPVVAATPLIFLSTMVPWVLQPNRFWVPLGVQRSPAPFGVQVALKHVAEWNRSAMYLPMENGKMAFGSLRTGLTPWFSSRVSFTLDTQAPGVATPMAPRKNARVPDWDCGMNAWIGAFLPPTWLQLVVVQSWIPASGVGVKVAGALVVACADQVTASPPMSTNAMPPAANGGSLDEREREDRAKLTQLVPETFWLPVSAVMPPEDP